MALNSFSKTNTDYILTIPVDCLLVAGGGGGGGVTAGGGGGGGNGAGKAGGSGIVIIRYSKIYPPAKLTTGSPDTSGSDDYWRVYKWTGDGSITF